MVPVESMIIHCLWALAKTHASSLWVQVSEHYNLCTKGTLFKSTGAAAWNPGKDVPNELIPDVTLCLGREETAGSHWDFHQVNLKLLNLEQLSVSDVSPWGKSFLKDKSKLLCVESWFIENENLSIQNKNSRVGFWIPLCIIHIYNANNVDIRGK